MKEKSDWSVNARDTLFPFGKMDNIARFAKIIENSPEGITLLDKNLQIIYRNSSAEGITGWSTAELILYDIESVVHEDDRGWFGVVLTELRALPGISKNCCFRSKRFDGNYIWLECVFTNHLNDPDIAAIVCNFRDVSVRKKAELASRYALEERNIILESIEDAFFAVDKHWTVTYWNNMAEKVLELPRREILNKKLWEVFSAAVGSKSYLSYTAALESDHAVRFEEYYAPLGKWFDVNAYPSEGGLSVFFKDITERKLSEIKLKELHESLQQRAKELATTNAELEQFAYIASHDLQEPLRMVTSFLTQLEKKYSDVIDEKGQKYIYFAVDGAKRMRQIILDLLEYSRVGRTDDDLEEVDLNKIVSEIHTLYQRQIKELKAVISYGGLPQISTHKTPVRQVIQNLISNSLKYRSPEKAPRIKIKAVQKASFLEVSVSDNGIGIAPEYFEKIFIIFQRLESGDQYPGTGMGLAISKKIIENLGGKIWVESTKGKGSTFFFTLLNHQQ